MNNKDEALRARDLAKDLMSQSKFTAARKYAMKAQQLDASLGKDATRMIMVCNVHRAALEKSGDETDWYKILQVEQNADDSTIKKQFKKLALHLHPDKNKLPGADSAFRLIKDAEIILSDTNKRRRHDMKRETVVVSSDSECEEYEEVPQAQDQKKPQAQPTGFGGGSTNEGFRAKSSSSSAVNNSGKRKRKTTAAAEFSANGGTKGRGKHDAGVKNPQRYLLNPKNPYFVQAYVSLRAITKYGLKFGAPYSTVNYFLPGGGKEESSLDFHGGCPFFRGWSDICKKLNLKSGDLVVCEIERSSGLVTAIRVHVVNE